MTARPLFCSWNNSKILYTLSDNVYIIGKNVNIILKNVYIYRVTIKEVRKKKKKRKRKKQRERVNYYIIYKLIYL